MTKPFFKIGLVGLMVIAMSVSMLFVFPQKAPGMPDGFATPIIAFEFARTPDDILTLFGPEGSDVRERMVRSMDAGNKLDYVYLVLYGLFLGLFSFQAARRSGQKLFYAGIPLAFIAMGSDVLENIHLLSITANLDSMDIEGLLEALHMFTWAKWGSLALAFLILAPYFFKAGGKFALTIGAVAVVCPVLAVLAFVHPNGFCEMFSVSVALMFVFTIVYCLIRKETT